MSLLRNVFRNFETSIDVMGRKYHFRFALFTILRIIIRIVKIILMDNRLRMKYFSKLFRYNINISI